MNSTDTSFVHAIDFGTTTSEIMVGRPKRSPVLIRDPLAGSYGIGIPTSVCARPDGSLAIGYEAERVKRMQIRQYRSEFKRDIGSPVRHRLGGRAYRPDELACEVLRFLRARALAEFPTEPAEVVITVPASWETGNRDLVIRAAAAAGYDPSTLHLETEPVAAIRSASEETAPTGTTMVYDLGGGTFDCAVAIANSDGPRLLGASFGLPHLGGREFDSRILGLIREHFPAPSAELFEADPSDDDALRRRIELHDRCLMMKITLSTAEIADELLSELDPPQPFELDRPSLDGLIADLLEQTVDECERMLDALGMGWQDVDRCVLVGGSSRLPMVADRLMKRSGCVISPVSEPELAVVRGAALLAVDRLPPGLAGPSSDPVSEPPEQVAVPAVPKPVGVRNFRPERNLFLER